VRDLKCAYDGHKKVPVPRDILAQILCAVPNNKNRAQSGICGAINMVVSAQQIRVASATMSGPLTIPNILTHLIRI